MNNTQIVVQDKGETLKILIQKKGQLKRGWYTHKTIIVDSDLDVKVYSNKPSKSFK